MCSTCRSFIRATSSVWTQQMALSVARQSTGGNGGTQSLILFSHLILLKLEMRASWTDDPNLHIGIVERSAGGRVTGARFPGRLSPLVVLVKFPRNWPIWYANFQVTERRSHQSWASAKIHAATRRWRWRTSVQLRLRHLHVDHRVRQPATRPIKDRLHAKDR